MNAKERIAKLETATGLTATCLVIARMKAFPDGERAFIEQASREELELIAYSGTPEENAVMGAMTNEEHRALADATDEEAEEIVAAVRARLAKKVEP